MVTGRGGMGLSLGPVTLRARTVDRDDRLGDEDDRTHGLATGSEEVLDHRCHRRGTNVSYMCRRNAAVVPKTIKSR